MSVNTVNDEFKSFKKKETFHSFTSLSEQLQIFNGEKQSFCLTLRGKSFHNLRVLKVSVTIPYSW